MRHPSAAFAGLLSALVLAAAGCSGDAPPGGPPGAPPGPSSPADRPDGARAPEGERDGEVPVPSEEDGRRRDGLAPVGAPYLCNGQELRRLDAEGPIRVEPPVVAAGQEFRVIVDDRDADEALVSLGGVSDDPIFAEARAQGDSLAVTLRVPADAKCGNKLLSVEGDVSAEAYVAVRR